jgi:hypothetical protein
VPGGGTAVIIEIAAEEYLPAWRAARGAVSRTGRWPVVTHQRRWEDFEDGRLFSREFTAQCDPDDPSVGAILRRAGELDLDAVLVGNERHGELWREGLEEDVDRARDATLARWGRAQSVADLRAAAAAIDHEVGIEAFLLSWERAQGSGVVLRRTYCRTRGCRCHADPPQPHGPYWQWTRCDSGRTITRRLTEPQAALYKEWIANRRRLAGIVPEMEKVGEQAAELLFQQTDSQPARTST